MSSSSCSCSKLHVELLEDDKSESPVLFHWYAVPETPPEQTIDGEGRFKACSLIHQGHSLVYEGYYYGLDGTDAVHVALKVVEGEDAIARLEKEARLYATALLELQGQVVPHSYGMYASAPGSGQRKACLMLEHCGRSWDVVNPKSIPIDDRMKVVDALAKIHDAHVLHGDFELRHVLSKPNDAQVYIVDFDRASDRHFCKRDQSLLRKYEYEPNKGLFGCNELYKAALELDIWTPSFVKFHGDPVYIWTNPTPDNYIKWCAAHDFEPDLDALRKEAERVLDEYYKTYQDRFPLIGDPRKGGRQLAQD